MGRTFRRSTPLMLGLLVIATLIAPAAQATGSTQAIGTIAPNDVPAGSTQAYSFTLKTTSSTAAKSFKLTPPPGWTILGLTSPPGGVSLVSNQIKGLNVFAKATSPLIVNFSAQAPCSATATAWGLVAKTSTNFGTGTLTNSATSDLSTPLTGACHLAFRVETATPGIHTPTEPADAEKAPTAITTVDVNPGDPVQVEAEDGADHRIASFTGTITLTINSQAAPPSPSGMLSGTVSVAAVGGIASFAPAIDLHADYTLKAATPGFVDAISASFEIVDDACATGETCSASNAAAGISVETTNNFTGTTKMSLDPAGDLNCGDSFRHAPLTTTVDQVGGGGTGTQLDKVTISKDFVNSSPHRLAVFFQVCFNGPKPFPMFPFGREMSPSDPVLGGYTALLPLCIFVLDSSGQPVPPCVLYKYNDFRTGEVKEGILFVPGDPKHR